MKYNIHPFLLTSTLILVTVVIFLLYYLPITLKTIVSNHKKYVIDELSNDLFDDTFILTQLNQILPQGQLAQSQAQIIQKQIHKKILSVFLLTSIILFLLSKKTFYNLPHINNSIFTTVFITLTVYLFLRFILQETIFTDINVIKYTFLQIAIEKFKNKDVNLQDLFLSEINEIKDKIQQISNNMTIPNNVMIPPTDQTLITAENLTSQVMIPHTNQKLITSTNL
jgi:hypothetical protein